MNLKFIWRCCSAREYSKLGMIVEFGVGRELAGEISEKLEMADVILLLVSPYFLASDYCYDVEMTRAMDRNANGSARVVPVILDPCGWHGAPFGSLLATPKDGKPISKHANLHDGFLEVVQAIRKAAHELEHGSPNADKNRTKPGAHAIERGKPRTRSSNLRVTRSFTDSDRDGFLDDSFEYIANFFENSLDELASRNLDITTRFKRLSDSRFTTFLYRNGQSVSECCVRQDNTLLGSGLVYSSVAASDNSFNESLSVDDDGHALLLRPMGMATMGRRSQDLLSQHGAAEYLWSILMYPLQQRH